MIPLLAAAGMTPSIPVSTATTKIPITFFIENILPLQVNLRLPNNCNFPAPHWPSSPDTA
jgi:hypothetical protein